MSGVDVRANLRMALQHVLICAPDATVEAAIAAADDAVAELIAAAKKAAPEWEPLLTADDTIAAIAAGRHVEFTACGNEYNEAERRGGWIVPMHDRGEPDGVRDAFELGGGRRYRARTLANIGPQA